MLLIAIIKLYQCLKFLKKFVLHLFVKMIIKVKSLIWLSIVIGLIETKEFRSPSEDSLRRANEILAANPIIDG